ncbi:MMPL family transporter [Permianibacter sp. IMCC34836]|uniref:MMPL family transporter n=1 Tax=Permianibacter fluminis TaxID=2738515 RepID=UPI001555DF9A|nr:MMPL family transporter [Permianibacter fluminis]NQD35544.1 MMPL family transporter [Permianibacter fluminis]
MKVWLAPRILLFLFALILAAAFVGQRLRAGDAFSTDLLALLPSTEREPLAEQAAQQVQATIGSHSIFLLSHPDRDTARRAAQRFADSLRQSAVFERIQFELPATAQAAVIEALLPYRSALLTPADAQLLQQGGEALQQRVLQALYSPLAVAVPGGDPLGFFANSLQGLSARSGGARPDDGLLALSHDGRYYVLVDAISSRSVFDDQYQNLAMAALNQAKQVAQTEAVEVIGTGTLLFAAQARAQGERDFSVIASISTIGVLLLVLLVFRRVQPLLLMLAVIGASLLGATALCLLIYGRLHLLTYVFGTTLIGIAGDYALHYLTLHASSTHWDARAAMRQLFKPLTVAMLTTFAAYLAIALTPFSAFRQIAFFCMLGLLCGYVAVLLLLPAVLAQASDCPPRGLAWMTALHDRLLRLRQKRRPLQLAIALLVLLALPGLYWLHADDDIHLLQKSDPGLLAQQQQIAALLQLQGNSQFFLVRANSAEQLLQRERQLTTALAAARAQGLLLGWRALSDGLPTTEQQQANIRLLQQVFADGGNLNNSLRQLEFTSGEIAELQQRTLSSALLDLPHYLALPHNRLLQAQLLQTGTEHGNAAPAANTHSDEFASIVLLDGIHDLAAVAAIQGDGVLWVDKTASISALFAQFRQQASHYVLLAYGATLLWLLWQCGAYGAFVRLLPTALASGMTLAMLGYLGQPFNLFTGIALLLVLGIGIDYALFLAEGEGHEPVSLLAILLSALTAVLGFGLLVGASLPAVSGFGLTVLLGVLLALMLAPLTLVLSKETP